MIKEIARNPKTTSAELDLLVSNYDGDRDTAEALFLNPKLSTASLSLLLEKAPTDLQILALNHPHLPLDQQFKIISSLTNDEKRTKAKSILLERIDITKEILTIFCLDPNPSIREKALLKLRLLNDPNNNHSE